jgi:hypothetical protein
MKRIKRTYRRLGIITFVSTFFNYNLQACIASFFNDTLKYYNMEHGPRCGLTADYPRISTERKSLLHGLREIFTFISHGPPGERFMNYYRLRKKKRREHPLLNMLYILTGIGLILAGAFLFAIPGVPGIVLGIPGLAMLAARSKAFARLLDITEILLRGIYRKVLGVYSRHGS